MDRSPAPSSPHARPRYWSLPEMTAHLRYGRSVGDDGTSCPLTQGQVNYVCI